LQISYPETQISWTKAFLGVLKDNYSNKQNAHYPLSAINNGCLTPGTRAFSCFP